MFRTFGSSNESEYDDYRNNPFHRNGYENIERSPIFNFTKKADRSAPAEDEPSRFSTWGLKILIALLSLLGIHMVYTNYKSSGSSIESNSKVGDGAGITIEKEISAASEAISWAHYTKAVAVQDGFNVNGRFDIPSHTGVTFTFFSTTKPEGINDICNKVDVWKTNSKSCYQSHQSKPVEYTVNPPVGCDIIRWADDGKRVVTFSEPVDNLHFAIVSLRHKYYFNRDFEILSDNSAVEAFNGKGALEKVTKACGLFGKDKCFELHSKGGASSGVIRFGGSTETITYFNPVTDNWHGLQMGVMGGGSDSRSSSSSDGTKSASINDFSQPERSDLSGKDDRAMCDLSRSLKMPKNIKGWQCKENNPTTPSCSWEGVTCSGSGFVNSIILTSRSIRGSLSESMSKLTGLKKLDLSDNLLEGSLKPLEKLSSIEELSLSDNSFSGTVSTYIGRLSKLKTLCLNHNQLSGEIPGLFNRPGASIQAIDLSDNKFDGPIPSSFGKISSLNILKLSGNSLSGPVPYEFCDAISTLDTLNIEKNRIDCYPKCLSILKNLKAEKIKTC